MQRRSFLLALLPLALATCGGQDWLVIEPRGVDLGLDFPDDEPWRLAEGASLHLRTYVQAGDVDRNARLSLVTSSSPDVLDAALSGTDEVIVTGASLGEATLTVADGELETEQRFIVEPVAATTLLPLAWLNGTPPVGSGEPIAASIGLLPQSSVLVLARHQAADGAALLGSGHADWSVSGLPDVSVDASVGALWLADLALVQAGTTLGTFSLSAGDGAVATVEVLPSSRVARLELAHIHVYPHVDPHRTAPGDPLLLSVDSTNIVYLLAFDADGRTIAGEGDAAPTVTASSDAILPEPATGRTLRLEASTLGTGTLTITWAGATLAQPFVVAAR